MIRLALCLALVASAAAAQVRVGYATGGAALFSLAAPDGWLVNTGEETAPDAMPDGRAPAPRVVSFLPPAPEPAMWAGIWSPPELYAIADARAWFAALQQDLLTDPQITGEADGAVAGFPARVLTGTGARDGRAFAFTVKLIQFRPDRVAVAAFIGEPEAQAAYGATLDAALNSFEAAP